MLNHIKNKNSNKRELFMKYVVDRSGHQPQLDFTDILWLKITRTTYSPSSRSPNEREDDFFKILGLFPVRLIQYLRWSRRYWCWRRGKRSVSRYIITRRRDMV
jgi:hypothetical protein